jgi:carboxyl-terminal processing protease
MDAGKSEKGAFSMKVRHILSHCVVAILATALTLFFAVPQQDPGIGKLQALETLIDGKFVEEYDETVMYDAAASAMIDSLGNRWSYYIPASEYQSYLEQMKNAYVGIGVTIVVREDGYIDIQKVEPGGPAQEAGIQPGDILVGVEGQDVASMTLEEVKNLVRGKAGTQVQLQLRRGEETLTLNVYRKEIQTVVASGTMLMGKVGLVQIVNFDSRCMSETLTAVKQLLDQGAQALIFDVRYNPGGYKDEMVGILDYLLPKVAVFRSVDYTGKEEVDYSDEKCLDIPMAVLVNQDSYSAAELFAAALQEYEVAVVVGEHTTGKGHYQNTYRLPDGSAAVLSVGRYTTPKGVNLDGVGIAPDVEVLVEEELYWQIYAGNVPPEKDPQIQAALAALLE